MQNRREPVAVRLAILSGLLVDHVLILGGAFFLVAGSSGGHVSWETAGASLIVVGVGIEVAIIGWSASVAQRSRRQPVSPTDHAVGEVTVRVRHLCPSCGWSGSTGVAGICRVCHRPTVRML